MSTTNGANSTKAANGVKPSSSIFSGFMQAATNAVSGATSAIVPTSYNAKANLNEQEKNKPVQVSQKGGKRRGRKTRKSRKTRKTRKSRK